MAQTNGDRSLPDTSRAVVAMAAWQGQPRSRRPRGEHEMLAGARASPGQESSNFVVFFGMREVARGRSPWDGRTDGLGSFCSPAVAPCGGRLAGEMQQGAAQGQGSARGGRNRREVKSGRRIWVVRLQLQNCPPWQLLGLNWRGRRVARGR